MRLELDLDDDEDDADDADEEEEEEARRTRVEDDVEGSAENALRSGPSARHDDHPVSSAIRCD